MKIEETRLSVLFKGVAEAVDASRFGVAVRLADSARRFAPFNPTAVLLHSRLLLKTGAAAAAAENLRGRDERDCVVLRAEAARQAGWLEESRSSCQSLLFRYAVDGVEGLAAAARRLCQAHPERFPGWVGVTSRLRLVGEVAAGSVVTVERDGEHLGVIDTPGSSDTLVGFSTALPPGCTGPGGLPGRIRVRAGRADLLGSRLRWPPDFGFSGWVVLEDDCLSGEVCLNWTPDAPVQLLVTQGDTDIEITVPPTARGTVGWPWQAAKPFSVRLARFASSAAELRVRALLPSGATVQLAGSPIEPRWQPRPMTITTLGTRKALAEPGPAVASPAKVNIVVPVYSGMQETLDCLHSVVATMPRDIATLTIVDDASPDPLLCKVLERFEREPSVTVVRNSVNLGFPGAANRGMRLHRGHDVVLLNADTEVFGDWLERLQSAAYSANDIGTVTPLGEAASIASYPKHRAGHAYSTAEAAEIDRITRAVHANEIVDVPIGVGFCLYVRRSCLEDVGEFDERAFAKGYGEENDLCLRARQHGWRHVVATGLFVRHSGGRSYGPAKDVLMKRNSRVINYRYPGYDRLVADFITTDPLHKVRRTIDRQRLVARANKPVLLVSLELAGGVKRHVDQRQSTLQAMQHTVLVLRAASSEGGRRRAVVSVAELGVEHLHYDVELAQEVEELRRLLLELRLVQVEIHHFLGLPGPVLEMVAGLGVRYRVFIHDYAWICPRVSLLSGAGKYCGEPAIEACEACVAQHGSAFEESITVVELRQRSARILSGAEQVIAPTRDVSRRLSRHFPDVRMDVVAWETPLRPRRRARRAEVALAGYKALVGCKAPESRIRVALIGAIGTSKGYSVLLDCARDAAARNLPLDFIVIGYTRDDDALLRTGRVFITGPYEESEVATLLERECCDVALFPSLTPETWCYTLTHAVESGLPIVAFDLGAIRERLGEARLGLLLPWETPAASVNDVLLRQASESNLDNPSSCNTTNRKGAIVMQPDHSSDVGQAPAEIPATVQVITLPVGIYAFTVKSGGNSFSRGLALPALQVTPAPLSSNGTVEFLNGPTTLDRWLTRSSDVVTIKISQASAALLLTSLSAPGNGSEALAIAVRRLDVPASPAQAGERKPDITPVGVTTLVHVQNTGDLEFTAGWAGQIEESLWIEAFAITLQEPAVPDLLEYRGVMYGGTDTSWLGGGTLCGTRGAGTPLVAFAVRVREDAPAGFACAYKGRFLSGSVVGPFADGRLCRSEIPDDPLVGIELQVSKLEGGRAAEEGESLHIAAA